MNSYERLFSVMEGREADRIPNLNILMMFSAKEIGCLYSDYCTDYKKLVEGNIVCAEKYGIDVVTVMSDAFTEGSDLGMDIIYPEDEVPYPAERLIKKDTDILKLKIVKPEDGKRMTNRLNAVRLFKEKVGGEIPIIGWVEGCFAESADIRGVNEFLMDVMDREQYFYDMLDFCLEQALVFAKAQIDAGADIIGVGDAIASVAGPVIYQEIAAEYERKLLKGIKDMGAKTKLHICGNTEPLLPYLPIEYIDIMDIDWMVSLEKAAQIIGDKAVISGNYDPVAVLLDGDTDCVDRWVRKCADICGKSYATSAGCEVPKFTKPENLMQVNKTVIDMI